jgi:hypothetical protein
MTHQELIESTQFTQLHTSKIRGYVTRKAGYTPTPQPYKGKFGEGWTVKTPRWDTTRFCNITYFIRK